MSRYLIDRLAGTPNIELMTGTTIAELAGDGDLERIRWRSLEGEAEAPIRHLFLFVGADPASEWIGDCGMHLDDKRFVATGETRAPLETSGAVRLHQARWRRDRRRVLPSLRRSAPT